MIRLRLTKSTFLDPRILSEMSHNQLSIEDANLLIVCLDLKKNGKCYPICDAKTSEYKSNIVQMLESSKQTSTLCFVDPQERKELHNATLCKLV